MLQLENLTIRRETQCITDNINLTLEKGKVYTILGPNGAGKSSMLKTIFGEVPFHGTICSFRENLATPYVANRNLGISEPTPLTA